eukprot:3276265-Rhodomonas_salina.2
MSTRMPVPDMAYARRARTMCYDSTLCAMAVHYALWQHTMRYGSTNYVLDVGCSTLRTSLAVRSRSKQSPAPYAISVPHSTHSTSRFAPPYAISVPHSTRPQYGVAPPFAIAVQRTPHPTPHADAHPAAMRLHTPARALRNQLRSRYRLWQGDVRCLLWYLPVVSGIC